MFELDDADLLHEQLNIFQVPMFIAERRGPGEAFRLLAINEAHSRVSGLMMCHVAGRGPEDILPPDQAADVSAKYARCADSQQSLRYREVLDLADGPMLWDTTIQPIPMDSDGQRILGNAVYLKRVHSPGGTQLAFEDVQFFSAQAAFQLGQVSTYIDALDRQAGLPDDYRSRLGVVSGICRSIDSALADIRAVAERQLDRIGQDEASREPRFLIEDSRLGAVPPRAAGRPDPAPLQTAQPGAGLDGLIRDISDILKGQQTGTNG